MQPFGYGFKPNLFTPNNAAGLQIVPYKPAEPTVDQKVPLTPEQLDNLYKMNYAVVQPYATNPNVYSFNMPRPVVPPPIYYPVNSAPGAFAPSPPTLQQPAESNVAANYNQSVAGPSYSPTSNLSQQYFQPNVINPQSALVHVPKVCTITSKSFDFSTVFNSLQLPPKQNLITTNPYTLPKNDSINHRNKRLGDDLIDLDIGSDNKYVNLQLFRFPTCNFTVFT